MSEKRPVPRLFLIRHGETEWSKNGRHTGRTDLPLTERGVEAITKVAPQVVGAGKLIDPDTLCHVFVSPRQRAHRTFELLFSSLPEPPKHVVTEEVREWDYGDYEGLTNKEILEKDPYWSIWKDGCPRGETVDEMTKRVDQVVAKVHEIHRQFFEEGIGRRDVMIVAHGHFSRRYLVLNLVSGTHFNVEPAGISLLTYNHRSLKEPALTGMNLYAL
ncbi:hypothetical protein FRB99_008685 [Tulasnella sp. 403]|nr:hypothetical protein FRB99_008685 [Tulasnella sp. 403]